MIIDYALMIGIASAIAAVLSAIFAFVAINVAEKSNVVGLIVELHQLYHMDTTFRSTQMVWGLYKRPRFTKQEFQALLEKYPSTAGVLEPLTINDVEGDNNVYIKAYKITKEQKENIGEAYIIIEKRANEVSDGTPISRGLASHFIKKTEELSPEWEAVHNASSFWRYLAFLVEKQYIDEAVVFRAFSSPKILGFLYPIENAFVGRTGRENGSPKSWMRRAILRISKRRHQDFSLERLYQKWKKYHGRFSKIN